MWSYLAMFIYIGDEENPEFWLVQTCTRWVQQTEGPVCTEPVCGDCKAYGRKFTRKNQCITVHMTHK